MVLIVKGQWSVWVVSGVRVSKLTTHHSPSPWPLTSLFFWNSSCNTFLTSAIVLFEICSFFKFSAVRANTSSVSQPTRFNASITHGSIHRWILRVNINSCTSSLRRDKHPVHSRWVHRPTDITPRRPIANELVGFQVNTCMMVFIIQLHAGDFCRC